MKPHFSVITLGVDDMNRAKQFYSDLGWPVDEDYGVWITFGLNGGTAKLGLYPNEALAGDAGVHRRERSGFAGFTLSYLVRSPERVDAVLAEAERAGGKVLKPAEDAQWGGRSGYFADPDGHLWKVASGSGEQPFAE